MIVRFLSRDLFTVTILRFPVKLSALVFLSLKHVSTMFCLTAHLLRTLRQLWTLWHVLWCLYWLSCTVLESFLIFPLYFTVHKLCLFVSWKNFSQICAVHEAKKKPGICLQTKRNTVNLSLILQVMSDRISKIFPFVTDITTVGFTSKYADW